jgi:glyceraldehyde-3-phosphate dehydrogenase/erythrose-4-phosphate dehydrogenase
MFKYDSTHGRYPGEVHGNSDGLFIDGKKIQSYSMKFVYPHNALP